VVEIELYTDEDEQSFCPVRRAGRRCNQTTVLRFLAEGCDEHEQELYAYCCSDCGADVANLLGSGYSVTRGR
jgi:hypothetical protein